MKSQTLERGIFSAKDGRRSYSPELGRWLSRDPIGEQGGLNVYGFLGNLPVSQSDYLGMFSFFEQCLQGCQDKVLRRHIFEINQAYRDFQAYASDLLKMRADQDMINIPCDFAQDTFVVLATFGVASAAEAYLAGAHVTQLARAERGLSTAVKAAESGRRPVTVINDAAQTLSSVQRAHNYSLTVGAAAGFGVGATSTALQSWGRPVTTDEVEAGLAIGGLVTTTGSIYHASLTAMGALIHEATRQSVSVGGQFPAIDVGRRRMTAKFKTIRDDTLEKLKTCREKCCHAEWLWQ